MGNQIQINDQLAIKSDKHQWMLCKLVKTTDKKTKEKTEAWTAFQYFSSLSACVKATGEYLLRAGSATNADELLKAADEISRLLSQKFTASYQVEVK